MEIIDKKDCTKIGKFVKTHGITGELTLILELGLDIKWQGVFVFLEIDGGLVPFYIGEDGLRFKSNESAIIKFDYIDSQEKAKEIVNCELFVFTKDLTAKQEKQTKSYNNYTVFDKIQGHLGTVIEVNNFSGNKVITVLFNSHEVMIPLSNDILQNVDREKRELHIISPKGLLDIY